MIQPTPGRVVWYYPTSYDNFPQPNAGEPLAAHIARIWSDTCVNLMVIDANGNPHGKTSVMLAQDRDAQPGECAWMPYQQGQAKAAAPTA